MDEVEEFNMRPYFRSRTRVQLIRPWTEREAQDVLARSMDWAGRIMLPNFHLAGGEMDMLYLTDSGYITEMEIKLSVQDWNADREKSKWKYDRFGNAHRAIVSRFYYVIPETLKDRIPEWVTPETGIILLKHFRHGPRRAVIFREAKRISNVKADPKTMQKIMKAFYFRYWSQRLKEKGPVL